MLIYQICCLTDLLSDSIGYYEDQFNEAGIKTTVDIQKDVFVYCDRFRMDQVFVNLISNTIKYGAGNPVHVLLSAQKGEVSISIKDQGIGIDPKIQHLIFNRFERAFNSKVISGLGLGLYITKQIVAAHQGKISVESELGKGSTFTVTLPQRFA